MNLKHIASAKLLLSHWSPSKLNNLLEETDIEMSRALDYVSPNNIKVSCVQLALRILVVYPVSLGGVLLWQLLAGKVRGHFASDGRRMRTHR